MSRGTDEMLLPFGVKLLLVTLQQVGAWGARDQGTGAGDTWAWAPVLCDLV